MKRWSKLQSRLYEFVDEKIKFQIHCVAYPMRSQRGNTDIPRYWITLNKEIIWDYPKDFLNNQELLNPYFPYGTYISEISALIREYTDTPKEEIFEKQFKNDKWNLTDILQSVDRRIGKRRLARLQAKLNHIAVNKIIEE